MVSFKEGNPQFQPNCHGKLGLGVVLPPRNRKRWEFPLETFHPETVFGSRKCQEEVDGNFESLFKDLKGRNKKPVGLEKAWGSMSGRGPAASTSGTTFSERNDHGPLGLVIGALFQGGWHEGYP